MYVCLCQGVTDKQIYGAISEGARSMRDLRRQLGVCARCGKCGPCAREMLTVMTATARSAMAGCANAPSETVAAVEA